MSQTYSQQEIADRVLSRVSGVDVGSIYFGTADDQYVFSAGSVRFKIENDEFCVSSSLSVERKRGKFMESGTKLTRVIENTLKSEAHNGM